MVSIALVRTESIFRLFILDYSAVTGIWTPALPFYIIESRVTGWPRTREIHGRPVS